MSAYMIAQIEIDDPEEYAKYLAGFMPIFEKYGGELLVSSSADTEVIEGEWALARTVVMKFPGKQEAQAWYNDPDYKALARHRANAARANLVLVDGV